MSVKLSHVETTTKRRSRYHVFPGAESFTNERDALLEAERLLAKGLDVTIQQFSSTMELNTFKVYREEKAK